MKDLTAKDKAIELIEQFFDIGLISYFEAKQCALIAVNNEIESMHWINLLCPFDNYMKQFLNSKIDELKDVKSEIEKL